MFKDLPERCLEKLKELQEKIGAQMEVNHAFMMANYKQVQSTVILCEDLPRYIGSQEQRLLMDQNNRRLMASIQKNTLIFQKYQKIIPQSLRMILLRNSSSSTNVTSNISEIFIQQEAKEKANPENDKKEEQKNEQKLICQQKVCQKYKHQAKKSNEEKKITGVKKFPILKITIVCFILLCLGLGIVFVISKDLIAINSQPL